MKVSEFVSGGLTTLENKWDAKSWEKMLRYSEELYKPVQLRGKSTNYSYIRFKPSNKDFQ